MTCTDNALPMSHHVSHLTSPIILSPPSLPLSLHVLLHHSFLVDDVHRLCLAYVASCVEMSITYKVLKPHLSFILFSVVFPTLCLSPADIRCATLSYTGTNYAMWGFIVLDCCSFLFIVIHFYSLLLSVTQLRYTATCCVMLGYNVLHCALLLFTMIYSAMFRNIQLQLKMASCDLSTFSF